jgi:uncharacterized LabA/DUF88 family protein
VLSSGDADFKDPIDYIVNHLDKRFELAVFRSGVSTQLQSLSDRIYVIEDVLEEIVRDPSYVRPPAGTPSNGRGSALPF